MAEEGKRGRRGHPIKGSNRAGQLRALYAKGILSSGKGHGRGGKRGGYHPERGRALSRYAKASKSAAAGGSLGRNVPRGTQKAAARRALGHNHNTNAAKSHPSLAKSGLGMKAAHLRGSGGGGSSRAERIAEGRARARSFLQSERGQNLRSGVIELQSANRRTGRRDYDKEKKVKAAKDKLRAAGVKIKTGNALAKRGHGLERLKTGEYSGQTFVRDTPRFAEQKRVAARKAQRAAERESIIAPVRGKSRAERIAAGKAIADTSPRVSSYKWRKGYEARQAAEAARAAQTARRLAGRNSRVRRGEVKAAQEAEAARRQREERAAVRAVARNKRVAKAAALDRKRRIQAGQKVLGDFRARRDTLYNGRLF